MGVAAVLCLPFSYGQISDTIGLNNRLSVDAGGREFEVLATANFDVSDARFDLDERTLTLSILSNLEDNLGEITVPKTLLDGDLSLSLDGQEFSPTVRSNDRIWFIVARFNGTGMHTLGITGTESVGGPPEAAAGIIPDGDPPPAARGGGCLVATAVYGTDLAHAVQLLREVRDNTVLRTESGSAFMAVFGHLYYSFSPAIADAERQNPAFRDAVRAAITPLLGTLSVLNHAGIDSEHEMVAYGAGIIAAGAGVYVGPAVAGLVCLRRLATLPAGT